MNSLQLQDIIPQVAKAWLSESPLLLAYLVGGLMVIVNWKKAPRSSLLTLGGILIFLGLALVMPAIYSVVPRIIQQQAETAGLTGVEVGRRMESAFAIVNFLNAIVHTLGFVLVLIAVYAGRARTTVPQAPPLA